MTRYEKVVEPDMPCSNDLICKRPDRDVAKLVCGHPLPCPWHTITIDTTSTPWTLTVPVKERTMSSKFCYVGIKDCGCTVAAVVDDAKTKKEKKELASDVAGFVRSGLTIERKTVEWVRENLSGCRCERIHGDKAHRNPKD